MGETRRVSTGYLAQTEAADDAEEAAFTEFDAAETLELEDGREILYRTCVKSEHVDDETYRHPFVMVHGVVAGYHDTTAKVAPIVPGDAETRDYVREAIVERLKEDATFRSYAEDAVQAQANRASTMADRFDGDDTPLRLPDVDVELERTIQFSPTGRSGYDGPAAD